jgi:hypothetical protein
MRNFVKYGMHLSVLLCAGLWVASAPAMAKPTDNRSCSVWQDKNFGGDYMTVRTRSQYSSLGVSWSDQISGVQCDIGCFLRGWEAENFSGDYRDFQPSTSYVGDTWNNRISSLRVGCS